jgi:hypothetical protein
VQFIQIGNPKNDVRVYIHAVVKNIRLGLGEYNFGDGLVRRPCLELQYGVQELLPLSAMLRGMREAHTPPRVFIWDEDKAQAEIVVLFHLKRPNARVLEQIAGKLAAAWRNPEIVATGEADIAGDVMRSFLSRTEKYDSTMVMVTEADIAQDDEVQPIAVFEVPHIERINPMLDIKKYGLDES